jgi:hypothetical protein
MIRRAPETNGAQGTLNGAIKRQPFFSAPRVFFLRPRKSASVLFAKEKVFW